MERMAGEGEKEGSQVCSAQDIKPTCMDTVDNHASEAPN